MSRHTCNKYVITSDSMRQEEFDDKDDKRVVRAAAGRRHPRISELDDSKSFDFQRGYLRSATCAISLL